MSTSIKKWLLDASKRVRTPSLPAGKPTMGDSRDVSTHVDVDPIWTRDGLSRREFLIKTAQVGGSAVGLGAALAACEAAAPTGSPLATSPGTASPPPSVPGPEKPYRVAMLLPSFDQARWQAADGAFFVKRARELGMDPLPLQHSNNDELLQASQVETLLNQGIDGLVLVAVNVDAAKASVLKCHDAGVPVVAHNYIIPDVPLAGVSARDGVALGRMLATAVVELAPTGNYLHSKGEEGTDIARLKAEGGYEVLQPLVQRGDIKLVVDQFTRAWSAEVARQQMEQALTLTGNNIAAALTYCDCQAYGVVEALRAQGLAGKVIVSGEDAELEMMKLILKGEAHVSAWTKFDEMGVRSAELLYEALAKLPTTAPATVNNGWGDIPWFQISIYNVTKDGSGHQAKSVKAFVEENPWWIKPGDLEGLL
jgi:D-xylose transport system substrate-binding protein